MKRHNGGTKAAAGYYWNPKAWNIVTVEEEGDVLAGSPEDRFLRIPMPVMVPLALLISFVFVVFLPFIGLAMLAWAIGLKLVSLKSVATRAAMTALAPAWQPGEAYFAGKAEPPQPQDGTTPPPLADLEAEIATARATEASDTTEPENGPAANDNNE